MNSIIFINPSKVATLTISILWCAKKWCKMYSLILPSFLGLKHLSVVISSKRSRLDFHGFHCLAILSGICSSQSKLWGHKLWIIFLLSSMNGAASSSGSYIEFSDDNIPRLIKFFSFMYTGNPSLSSSMFQSTPSAFSLSGFVS